MYQSFSRGDAIMNALIALLVCLAAAHAVPAHFPTGVTVVYKYNADVKAGTMEPTPFASQFGIDGHLHVTYDTRDPTLKNAYHVALTDVKYALHNGHVEHHEHLDVHHPIMDAAKMIQDPFLIVYDENGKFQGVKLMENESGWSKNVKQAIASMLQLDLINMHVQDVPVKPHSFMTHENTIHGTCHVAYDVHLKDQVHPGSNNVFVVTKVYEPKSCTHFVQREFNHVDTLGCHVESQDDMTTACRRVFEVENHGTDILIKKVVAHEVINYFPWHTKSVAHYLLTNQTLVLESVTPVTDVQTLTNFQNVPMIRDVTYNKPQGNYALHAAEDLTQGRHIVKLDVLIPKLKKMLGEAADYLKENHMEVKQADWKHGQTINRLLHTMSYMDLGSLEQVYNVIQDAKSPREVTIKNVFLGMVPNVGTTAACHFTRNVIRNHKVSDLTAILMLSKLPMHVKVPSERLLVEMEELLKFGDSVSLNVRKASVLCFASLVHKTFKNEVTPGSVNALLNRYLQHFIDHVKNDPTYHMKMVYMMAIKNVGVGNIQHLLEPIIRGDVLISENPQHIRVQAIWAIMNVIIQDVQYAHDLLWPILADVTQPLAVRIAAYEVLVHQLPHMGRLMNLHWLMVYEKNDHLYNFHVTTMQGYANSVEPCLRPVREMARKILRFTKIRHVNVPLSNKYHVDYVDEVYGHGESVKAVLMMNELTGFPYVGSVEHYATVARKPVKQMGIHWMIHGMDDVMKEVQQEIFGSAEEPITNENVKNILLKAALNMPPKQNFHVDICITMNGQVVLAHHYNKDTWTQLFDDIKQWKHYVTDSKINWQHVVYDNLYEMHVPTDLGVPAVLATRIPNVMSLKLNTVLSDAKDAKGPLNLKLDVDARVWRHGEHVMSIYNPIADVWHSVRKATSRDVALPFDVTIGYNSETKSLKVTLPRLPITPFSVAGIATHAKSYVTVTDDETDVLKKSCDTCHHHEIVTDGVVQKKYFQKSIDSMDTGLQFYAVIYDCDNNVTPVNPMVEWYRVFSSEHKNTMNNKLVQMIMGVRQQLFNEMISPQDASCANLVKIEPSIVHPTSHIDMTMRLNVEDMDSIHDTLHVLSSKKVNVRGTVDVKAASTNASVRLWDMNVNIDLSQGHVNNVMKVQLTRITQGEKKLKICVEAQKNYPVVDVEPLKIGTTKEETNMKVVFSMGETDGDVCVRDETVVIMTTKGELSEEQKKRMQHDSVHGLCVKDMQMPHFQTQEGYVPKTTACTHEALLHTTLRKYTTNVAYRKVSPNIMSTVVMVQDIIRSIFFPHVKYTLNHVESGTVKLIVEYPVGTNHLDATVVTPIYGYEITELPYGDTMWNVLMDNTRFSIVNLYKYKTGQTKVCVMYPQVVLTFDDGTIPFVVSDHWTLISGDHVDHTYAVFVKSVHGTKLAMRVYIGGHQLEIMPTESKPIVTINGKVVENYVKGVMVPADEPDSYACKLTMNNEHLIIHSQRVPITLLYTQTGVVVHLDTILQGQVTGMCGHMDGTHVEKIPKVYSVVHL